MKLEEIEKMYMPSEHYMRKRALFKFVVDNIGYSVEGGLLIIDVVDLLNDHHIYSISDLKAFSLSDIKSKYDSHDKRIMEIRRLKEKLNRMIENDDSQ